MHLSPSNLQPSQKQQSDSGNNFRLTSALGLRKDGYVVHVPHGIGIYCGLVTLTPPTAQQGGIYATQR